MQEPQAVGSGQAVQLLPLGARQVGLARPAGAEQAALARAGCQIVKEVGEAAPLLVGVWAALRGGSVVELWQYTLKIVPDQQQVAIPEELDRPAALLDGRTLIKPRSLA